MGATTDTAEPGRSRRRQVPRSSHAAWAPGSKRHDPVSIIEEQNVHRMPSLVPLRRGRMSESPFAFFRGAAAVMAADLSTTPTSGFIVQLCGDAHLSNFGVYGSPERNLVFDVNDFDETLPGPFEWDVKRLATSFSIAGRHRGWDAATQRSLAEAATRGYRRSMASFATHGWMETWYTHVGARDLVTWVGSRGGTKTQLKAMKAAARRLQKRDHLKAARKLVEPFGDSYHFKSTPPVLVPLRELSEDHDARRVEALVHENFAQYRRSLGDNIRLLVDRYRLVDVALKVVGVGSVGTWCWVGLLMGHDSRDVLLLQVKEATTSVLEPHLAPSRYRLQGRRVVEGQRIMQASSDIFLGWSGSLAGEQYYWRQLKDWKGSVDLEAASPRGFETYALLCGHTLARAHAVSGDPAAIAGYLGSGARFDTAVGEFAIRYADQNDADHRAYMDAIAAGLEVEREA